MSYKKLMFIFGTRPEAIKMAPIILKAKEDPFFDVKICLTAQHREMLDDVMDKFGLKADYDLNIMKQRQTVQGITSDIITALPSVFEKENPDLVLVHGDTTTAFAAALAAFYSKTPVAHVEAGLRSGNDYSPFPEEMNRKLVSNIARLHFAPTSSNAANLNKEGITENIYVVGNSVIDALKYTVRESHRFSCDVINSVDFSKRVILMTAHRRENLGRPLVNILTAVKRIATEYPDVFFVYPVHPNPAVKDTAERLLSGVKNVILTSPVDVFDMHNLMEKCFFVLTDSGGLQEEAPALSKPVLVTRTETERPEAVDAGTVKIIGVDEETVYSEIKRLLTDESAYAQMEHAANPYGCGDTSEKIVEILKA